MKPLIEGLRVIWFWLLFLLLLVVVVAVVFAVVVVIGFNVMIGWLVMQVNGALVRL